VVDSVVGTLQVTVLAELEMFFTSPHTLRRLDAAEGSSGWQTDPVTMTVPLAQAAADRAVVNMTAPMQSVRFPMMIAPCSLVAC
jgi:hypothetical protein